MKDDAVGQHHADDGLSARALEALDHIPAMVAYWDRTETCRFANHAYLAWFGKTRDQLLGTTLRELLGDLYPLNEPYVRAAMAGEEQSFERSIPRPDGKGFRDSLATYTPDVRDGEVRGMWVHVADATALKQHERALAETVRRLDLALLEVNQLRGLLPVCAWCKNIRDEHGEWQQMEKYLSRRSGATFTHGVCPDCERRLSRSG